MFKLHFVNWAVTFEGKEVQSQTELGALEILRQVRQAPEGSSNLPPPPPALLLELLLNQATG